MNNSKIEKIKKSINKIAHRHHSDHYWDAVTAYVNHGISYEGKGIVDEVVYDICEEFEIEKSDKAYFAIANYFANEDDEELIELFKEG